VSQVIRLPLATTTVLAAAPPKVTVAPAWKLLPARVTAVPPPTGPWLGVTPVTVGLSVTVTVCGVLAVPSRAVLMPSLASM